MITALQIKHALMYYFRFQRQCICASECLNNDVMVATKGGMVSEIEVKISKYDLWKGEAKKSKHKLYKNYHARYNIPNKFYICVPTILIEEAKNWVEATNNKYGIIRYISSNNLEFIKKAKKLHSDKSNYLELSYKIMMRVCSENIGLIERSINERPS